MPKMPCLTCGIPTQRSRCDKCAEIYLASKPQRVRATPTERGYDYEWRKVRIRILTRDNWTCYYCQKKLIGADATVDHKIALNNGGRRLDPGNLVSACRSCNSRKSDR